MKTTKTQNGLKSRLILEAKASGICTDGLRQMYERNLEGLIDYYVSNPDWCLERGFPDFQTLVDKFSDCEDKGVYINRHFDGELINDRQVYIFHNCKGRVIVRLNVERCVIPMFYLANSCDMEIFVKDRSVVPVYVFGDNSLKVHGNVKIHKENLI